MGLLDLRILLTGDAAPHMVINLGLSWACGHCLQAAISAAPSKGCSIILSGPQLLSGT